MRSRRADAVSCRPSSRRSATGPPGGVRTTWTWCSASGRMCHMQRRFFAFTEWLHYYSHELNGLAVLVFFVGVALAFGFLVMFPADDGLVSAPGETPPSSVSTTPSTTIPNPPAPTSGTGSATPSSATGRQTRPLRQHRGRRRNGGPRDRRDRRRPRPRGQPPQAPGPRRRHHQRRQHHRQRHHRQRHHRLRHHLLRSTPSAPDLLRSTPCPGASPARHPASGASSGGHPASGASSGPRSRRSLAGLEGMAGNRLSGLPPNR